MKKAFELRHIILDQVIPRMIFEMKRLGINSVCLFEGDDLRGKTNVSFNDLNTYINNENDFWPKIDFHHLGEFRFWSNRFIVTAEKLCSEDAHMDFLINCAKKITMPLTRNILIEKK